jgi:SAM-dependent methyltransferase
LSILEAGCGHRRLIDLTGVNCKVTGVDLDPAALEVRKTKTGDLDVAICGDLCSVELPEASFDVVFSGFVLEHVEHADLALTNLVKWLKAGGLLILRLPDPGSVRGFYAKLLPFRAHVWYYRYLLRDRNAGLPGYAPYPTCYHPVIDRERLCRFLADRDVECLNCYSDGFRRDHSGILVRVLIKLTAALSFGNLTADHSDILYLALKAPNIAQD